MKTESRRIFDHFLEDAGSSLGVTTHTSLEHTEFLTSADRLGLQAFVSVRNKKAPVPLEFTLQHSGDGRLWKRKNALPELSTTVTADHDLYAGESTPTRPSLRFVRLQIEAGAGLTANQNFSLYLVVTAVAVRRTKPHPARVQRKQTPEYEGVRELREAFARSRHLQGEERAAHVLRNVSRGTRDDLLRIQQRLATLRPEHRQVFAGAARALAAWVAPSRSLGDDAPERGPEVSTGGRPPPSCGGCGD